MSGTGVWVVEDGCKYDNCGDVTRHGSYDNEAAARAHGDWLEEHGDVPDSHDVRVYELRKPDDIRSTFEPIGSELGSD